MSFSILSCALSSPVVIHEKKCVEKTWPSWWDTFSRVLGAELNGVDPVPALAPVSMPKTDDLGSIFLIGMRGAGKTHLGKALALRLG